MGRVGRCALALGMVLALCCGVVRAAETAGNAAPPEEGEVIDIQDASDDAPLLAALAPDGAPILIQLCPQSLDDLRELLSEAFPLASDESAADVENVEPLQEPDEAAADVENVEPLQEPDEAAADVENVEPVTLEIIHQDLISILASIWLLAGAFLGFKIWGFFRGLG